MRRESDPVEPGRVSIESPTLAFPRLADARLPVRSDPLCQMEHLKGSLAFVSGPDGAETGAASFCARRACTHRRWWPTGHRWTVFL